MKSLADYITIYSNIVTNLNLKGDSTEVLIQMLANASYISEVENITYMQESSLEKATLTNSKIQHCIDNMYSVYRGNCPRVVINFQPTKYFDFNMYDEIISSNNFKIYYIGYYDSEGALQNSSLTVSPSTTDTYTILGLVAKENVEIEWTLDSSNLYYVDCTEESLSNDLWVTIDGKNQTITREFSEHLLKGCVFDLTLTSFGSRLYVVGLDDEEVSTLSSDTVINAGYFKYSLLEDYSETELLKVSMKGATFIGLDENDPLQSNTFYTTGTGIYYIDAASRNDLNTIHYRANLDRYTNSIIRSNSDIGIVLEEAYPEKVVTNGTSYVFSQSSNYNSLTIYYVPKEQGLSDSEVNSFISSRSMYYVASEINIIPGNSYIAKINIDVELYESTSVSTDITTILEEYENKFNIILSDCAEDIKALISKISNVVKVKNFTINILNTGGDLMDDVEVANIDETKSYYIIEPIITSVVQVD